MRKSILVAALLFVGAASANAQDSYPTAEIFGGYSYLNIDGDGLGVDRQGLHGVGFSFAGNLSKIFGIVGDFSFHKKEIVDVGTFEADLSAFHYQVGPRFSWRTEQVTAFGHALVGGVRTRIEATGFGDESQSDLVLGFGGGLDVNVTKSIAIRVFQGDYLPTRVEDFAGDKRWANNFRAQAGIVIRLGAD
jgi:opacity protein-like surface antigen